jgi:hypothetical protein
MGDIARFPGGFLRAGYLARPLPPTRLEHSEIAFPHAIDPLTEFYQHTQLNDGHSVGQISL